MGNRKLLFSLSKENGDFIVQPFRGSGKGGQKRNKTASACRIIHPASGAISECQEERSFFQNRKKAFERLVNKEKFQKWLKQEIKIRTGERALMEAQVDAAMKPENLRIEHQNTDGTWSFLQ